MAARLLHYTHKPLEAVRSETQDSHFKPKGLWVSVEGPGDWKEWCNSENFRDVDKQLCYAIEVSDKVQVLSTPESIAGLTKWLGKPPKCGRAQGMDWGLMAEYYPGLIIAPCQDSLRFDRQSDRWRTDCDWYYVWDCASGCIWDSSAIESIELQTLNNQPAQQVHPQTPLPTIPGHSHPDTSLSAPTVRPSR